MSIMQMLLASSVSRYLMDKSVRLRSAASGYFNRTPSVAGSRTTWTWSGWVKIGAISASDNALFMALNNASGAYNVNDWSGVFLRSGSSFDFIVGNGGSVSGRLVTSQAFRDFSSWYHLVFTYDSTNATSTDRMRMYVNGSRVTAFSTATYPAINTNSYQNTTNSHFIGQSWLSGAPSNPFDGYLADVNFIDGQALTPASFGETNALTGVWQPKPYTGTYGTNGFYLDFETTTSVSALGNDKSGNGNNWTVNNISLTAGVTYDSMTDVPTLTSATVANYAVLNNISNLSINSNFSNANLQVATVSSGDCSIPATIGMKGSGKYYAEFVWTASGTSAMLGIIPSTYASGTAPGYNSNSAGYRSDGLLRNSGASTSSWGATWVQNDVMAIAFDAGAGTIEFYKNNVKQGSTLTGFTTDTYFFAVGEDAGAASATWVANFGQRPFAYTPPTGFVALNTFNLLDSAIVAGNKYFDATTYTGTGAIQTITNSGSMQPDLLWVKGRSRVSFHDLVDSVRGVNLALSSNSTAADFTGSFVTSLNSNGFTLPANTTSDSYYTNVSGDTFVAWQWKGGGAAVTNTAGTISSQVSASPTSGFSVVTLTTQASGTGTFGHGLGIAPSFIITKFRTITDSWVCYHARLGNTAYVTLSTTDASATASTIWNNTSPTSSVVTLGTRYAGSLSMVAYCFAEIDGFSKFGSYTGNGSADGPFIYCGFKPKFILRKGISIAGIPWSIVDGARNPYNLVNANLFPNTNGVESVPSGEVDFLSNGFKFRSSSLNISGETYIYAAFAESPFKNSLAR